jgi:hypothetical protein
MPAFFRDGDEKIFVCGAEYDTVRIPQELAASDVEEWVCVLSSHTVRIPDGRYARHLVLAHNFLDCLELLDGSGYLWIRKAKN